MEPLLSIVIANYNYGRFLEDSIRSVLIQSNDDIELIVVDGASVDNSRAVIEKYASRLTWWCSEKDKGQSDAFNKGFRHAHGRFITWLNADDILLPGTIDTLRKAVQRHPSCEWFTGNYLQFREDTHEVIFAPWGPHLLPGFVQTFNSPLVIFGPTTFWSRAAYEKIGPIDESLNYSMDTDYWLRMKKAGYKQQRLCHCCWAFRMHGESKTAQYGERRIEDKVRARWFEELTIVKNKVGYHCSTFRRLLVYAVRIFDGSALVSFYRKLFVVGRTFKIESIGERK